MPRNLILLEGFKQDELKNEKRNNHNDIRVAQRKAGVRLFYFVSCSNSQLCIYILGHPDQLQEWRGNAAACRNQHNEEAKALSTRLLLAYHDELEHLLAHLDYGSYVISNFREYYRTCRKHTTSITVMPLLMSTPTFSPVDWWACLLQVVLSHGVLFLLHNNLEVFKK